ncbi:MAG TPA: hypothetical protein VF126_06185 [Acidobacteriaceae bacterium]
MAVGGHHIGDGDIGGGGENGKGRRGQRIIGTDDFKHDSDLDCVRSRLKQELTEHGRPKCPWVMRQDNQTQCKKTAHYPICQIEEAQWQVLGKNGKEETPDNAGEECAHTSGKAHCPGRCMEIIAERSQQIRQREGTAWGEEQKQDHNYFSPPQQNPYLATELGEALCRQATVRPWCGHENENHGGEKYY